MQEQDEARSVNRRGLLRRAGTVAAGAAGVTVAGAMVSAPAQAAPGDAVTAGGTTDAGTGVTKLTGGSAGNPTLRLENPDANGASLSVKPTKWQDITDAAPAGSVFVDDFGDYNAISQDTAGNKYLTLAYSPTWAAMPVPLPPFRYVNTADAANGRDFVQGASYDSSGRIIPKGGTGPDAVIDLSPIFSGGYGAVQANLTIVNPTGQGYASLWDEGEWPQTSCINFGVVTGMPAFANFTQTLIGSDSKIRLKLNRSAKVLFDIVGFILADPNTQLGGAGLTAQGARVAGPQRRRGRKLG